MKRVVIFGSTGSIGRAAIRVLDAQKKSFSVLGLAAKAQKKVLKTQLEKLRPLYAVLPEPDRTLQSAFPETKFIFGSEGLEFLATLPEADIVLMAIPGLTGLKSTFKALGCGKTVALATKEIIVSAGSLMTGFRGRILPVDSEHNAIFQLLRDEKSPVEKIFLTASGGPFLRYAGKLENVTVKQVLNHPVWRMGTKVTVDSATMMNKGLELIEASYLFDLLPGQLEVLIHPQAVVHGLVLFRDGFLKGLFSTPDMRYSLNYCFNYPERKSIGLPRLHLAEIKDLTFGKSDPSRFPCLGLARYALKKGGSFPVVLNAVDEEAVKFFIDGKIKFMEIPEVIERVLEKHSQTDINRIEDIFKIDGRAREEAIRLLSKNR